MSPPAVTSSASTNRVSASVHSSLPTKIPTLCKFSRVAAHRFSLSIRSDSLRRLGSWRPRQPSPASDYNKPMISSECDRESIMKSFRTVIWVGGMILLFTCGCQQSQPNLVVNQTSGEDQFQWLDSSRDSQVWNR